MSHILGEISGLFFKKNLLFCDKKFGWNVSSEVGQSMMQGWNWRWGLTYLPWGVNFFPPDYPCGTSIGCHNLRQQITFHEVLHLFGRTEALGVTRLSSSSSSSIFQFFFLSIFFLWHTIHNFWHWIERTPTRVKCPTPYHNKRKEQKDSDWQYTKETSHVVPDEHRPGSRSGQQASVYCSVQQEQIAPVQHLHHRQPFAITRTANFQI